MRSSQTEVKGALKAQKVNALSLKNKLSNNAKKKIHQAKEISVLCCQLFFHLQAAVFNETPFIGKFIMKHLQKKDRIESFPPPEGAVFPPQASLLVMFPFRF